MPANRTQKGQAALDTIRGERLLSGRHVLTALEEMGLIPKNMRRVVITADVAEPVTIEWHGFLTGEQTATLLGQLSLVDDPLDARLA